MTETQIQHNQACTEDLHGQHLCFLMHEGFHYQKPAEYKALVQDARYRCRQCGRTARDGKNLCIPVGL